MRKPAGLNKEQWAQYQRVIKLSVDTASRCLDTIAEANFQAGEITERQRIIKAWDVEMECDCDNAFLHMKSRITGEQK